MEIKERAEKLIQEASYYNSSDVYIHPEGEGYRIYIRTNGGLIHYRDLHVEIGQRMISYFKFLGNMDVSERRRPQSGGAKIYPQGKLRNLRLSTMTNYQMEESLVIRLINPRKDFRLEEHTYFPQQVKKMTELVKNQSGLILFSGPVSSGKTTTMYQLIRKEAFTQNKSVITIEDPVEIEEERFLQIQVNEKAGISYDLMLRQSLRHHPDIIIIGEIRDEKTAQAAIRSALTGHLILATIHAKNAEGVLNRLIDLGVSLDLLQQVVIGIVFQKIIPRYCDMCQGNCHLSCNHLNKGMKKATLFDVRIKEDIKDILYEISDSNYNFNHWLRKAYCYGFIDSEKYYNYHIPE